MQPTELKLTKDFTITFRINTAIADPQIHEDLFFAANKVVDKHLTRERSNTIDKSMSVNNRNMLLDLMQKDENYNASVAVAPSDIMQKPQASVANESNAETVVPNDT